VLDVEQTAVFEKPPPKGRFVEPRRSESEAIATELAREAAECLAAQFVDLPSSRQRAAAFLFEELLGVNVVHRAQDGGREGRVGVLRRTSRCCPYP
jgi:hypothetical protein